MNQDVARVLDDLSYVSETLNKASDSLSKHILEVELALQRYRLGVPAWVLLDSWEEVDSNPLSPNITRARFLGYDKLKGKWGLLVCEGFDDEPPSEGNVKFLREMPRNVKLLAADKLALLLAKLLEEASNVTCEAIDKEMVAQEIVLGLKKGNK